MTCRKTFYALLLMAVMASACGRLDNGRAKADAKKSELMGPVKEVRSEVIILASDTGEQSREQKGFAEESIYDQDGFETLRLARAPDGSLLSRTTYKYDGRGNRSEEVLSDPAGGVREKKVFKTDERGNVAEWQSVRPDGSTHSKSVYRYDEKGNSVEWVLMNARSAVADRWTYGYDGEGRVIEESRYYADGTLDTKHVHELDDRGLRKESATYNGEGALVETQRYEYEFDLSGNWIKKITLKLSARSGKDQFVPVSMAHRTITYY